MLNLCKFQAGENIKMDVGRFQYRVTVFSELESSDAGKLDQ